VSKNGEKKLSAPKILLISDIHGNFDALKAIPDDYDELWVLGDLVNYGPQPSEVIEFVREKAALVVRGNHDDAVAFHRDPRCSAVFRRAAEETRAYTESVLSREEKDYLADLPHYRWVRRGPWTFYACHAAPSDPLYLYLRKDDPAWASESSQAGTDFLFVGHTHLPFLLQVGEQQVMNPGSVGQPKNGVAAAHFGIWQGGSGVLRSVNYPIAKTVARIREMPVSPETQEFLVKVLETGGVSKTSRERAHVEDQGA
jgi:putative phosphoesterase